MRRYGIHHKVENYKKQKSEDVIIFVFPDLEFELLCLSQFSNKSLYDICRKKEIWRKCEGSKPKPKVSSLFKSVKGWPDKSSMGLVSINLIKPCDGVLNFLNCEKFRIGSAKHELY